MAKYCATKIGIVVLLGLFLGCSQEDMAWLEDKADYKTNWQRLRYRLKEQKNYKNTALTLARENRNLRIRNNKMLFEINQLKGELALLKNPSQSGKKWSDLMKKNQKIASINAIRSPAMKKQNWKAEQAFFLAEKEFKKRNYTKAFEHFQSFAQNFPQHKRINDRFLFRTGLAGFETQLYHQAAWYFEQLVEIHPNSKLYRSSKLWAGLCHLKMGNKDKFIQTAQEFKNKYQNTPEWKVLKVHYENIIKQS